MIPKSGGFQAVQPSRNQDNHACAMLLASQCLHPDKLSHHNFSNTKGTTGRISNPGHEGPQTRAQVLLPNLSLLRVQLFSGYIGKEEIQTLKKRERKRERQRGRERLRERDRKKESLTTALRAVTTDKTSARLRSVSSCTLMHSRAKNTDVWKRRGCCCRVFG